LSLAIMFVLAVPRSIATSCERNENKPMDFYEYSGYMISV
jgi:hypothetical protein